MSRHTDDTGKLVLRLAVGGLLLMHGLAKVRDNSFVTNEVVDAGLPPLLAYGVFLGEVVAPIFLIIGLFTRVAAGVIAIDMLFALSLAHASDLATITPTGGWAVELPAMFLLGAIAIIFLGPGTFAVAWNPSRDVVTESTRARRPIEATPITHHL